MPVLEIVSAEQLQSMLGKDVPRTAVQPLILGASIQVEKYLDRSLLREDFTERLNVARGQRTFSVRHSPITELTSVENDGDALDLDSIRFTDHWIMLDAETSDLVPGPLYIEIQGNGGMAETREEFQQLYPDIVMELEHWLAIRLRRLTAPDIASMSSQGTQTNYRPSTMPESLIAVLDSHRRRIGAFA